MVPTHLCCALLVLSASAHVHVRRSLESAETGKPGFPFISYSDDGGKTELDPFLLDIFETDTDLPAESVSIVEAMTNLFLTTELNKLLPSHFPVDFVNTTVVGQSRVLLQETRRKLSRRERIKEEISRASLETMEDETSYLRHHRHLEEKAGTALEVFIDVVFQRSPSPVEKDVNEKVKMIMTDLSVLLSSLTSSNDPFLAEIYLIRRRELSNFSLPDVPSVSPSDGGSGDAGTRINGTGDDGTSEAVGYNPQPTLDRTISTESKIGIISGSLTAAIAILLMLLFFALRNRREDEDESAQKEMFLQMGSDVESSMGSLSSTPRGCIGEGVQTPSSAAASQGKSESLFSGISDLESPRHRSIQSRISMSSQTTVQASGKGPAITPTSLRSPCSLQLGGSLFAFEEDALEDEEESSPSTPWGASITHPAETPSQLINKSTPSTDMAIVHGEKHITPLPFRLRRNSPVTDHAVNLGLMAQDDAAVRDLLYDADGVSLIETPVKTNLTENSFYGLPPKSPRSQSKGRSPISPVNKRSLGLTNGESATHGVNGSTESSKEAKPPMNNSEPLDYDWTPFESDPTVPFLAGGAALGADTAAAIATRRSSLSPVARLVSSSPILVSPKKNKYTGLAATGKSFMISPGVAYKKNRYKELMANLDPRGWKRESLTPAKLAISSMDADDEPQYEVDPGGAFPTFDNESPIARHRRHVGYKGEGDGAADYQNGAMHPVDWSNKDDSTIEGSSLSGHREAKKARRFFFAQQNKETLGNTSPGLDPMTPSSIISTLSGNTSAQDGTSHVSASQQLIQDLVWLEQKIASGKALSSTGAPSIAPTSPSVIEAMDSMSYVSGDEVISPSSNEESTHDTTSPIMQSIVCRDCFAPPGKLQIVIHSTKDGPAVHTVKSGSSLEGHMFPGDLIIAVDNVDTRTFSAEAVMKMMAENHTCERKITVLHFDA